MEAEYDKDTVDMLLVAYRDGYKPGLEKRIRDALATISFEHTATSSLVPPDFVWREMTFMSTVAVVEDMP